MEEWLSLLTTAMNRSFFPWRSCGSIVFLSTGFFHHCKLEGKVNESWIERSIVFFRERTGFLKCWCLGYAMALLSLFLLLCSAASSISMQKPHINQFLTAQRLYVKVISGPLHPTALVFADLSSLGNLPSPHFLCELSGKLQKRAQSNTSFKAT